MKVMWVHPLAPTPERGKFEEDPRSEEDWLRKKGITQRGILDKSNKILLDELKDLGIFSRYVVLVVLSWFHGNTLKITR